VVIEIKNILLPKITTWLLLITTFLCLFTGFGVTRARVVAVWTFGIFNKIIRGYLNEGSLNKDSWER
jgi:hypothetical protein